ncbi:hypothetical protein EMN47_00885 [Prolixibacteraceae bacterium JC049]|nr:hypothetical protein [Prolixibacteraceae bacterium JC049]
MSEKNKKWSLDDASPKAPFEVPKNYFDEMQHKIMAEVEEMEAPQKKGIIHHLKPALGLVASFIVVGLLVYVPMKMYMPSVLEKYYGQSQQESTFNADSTLIFADLDAMNYFEDEFSTEEIIETTEDQSDDEQLLNYLVAELDDYDIVSLTSTDNYN